MIISLCLILNRTFEEAVYKLKTCPCKLILAVCKLFSNPDFSNIQKKELSSRGPPYLFVFVTTVIRLIQVLQVGILADFQFTQVYTGLPFLPPDVRAESSAEEAGHQSG